MPNRYLGVIFKNLDEHPRHVRMGVPPPPLPPLASLRTLKIIQVIQGKCVIFLLLTASVNTAVKIYNTLSYFVSFQVISCVLWNLVKQLDQSFPVQVDFVSVDDTTMKKEHCTIVTAAITKTR